LPVGIADRDQRVLIETMLFGRNGNKICEFVCPRDNIFFIENALSQPSKNRGAPFSKTFPRGLSKDASGSMARPSGSKSFSFPPVPCSKSSVRSPVPGINR
jgi:hypothetical protein